MDGHIHPLKGGNAILLMLRMAEMYERWPLFKQLLTYLRDAGGCIQYLGPEEYIITYPKKD